MNNSVFGKTMKNLRKWVDVRLMTDEKKLDKLTSKPTSVSSKIFNKNLMAVHKIKESQTLNRPAYLGMCILDLSKMLMYYFHYGYIKRMYGNKAKLLFTDMDSLMYEIEMEDVYKDFWNDKDMLTIVTIQKTHHIIAISIRRSSVDSKMSLSSSDCRIHRP